MILISISYIKKLYKIIKNIIMKYQLNWQLFDLSSNHLLKKKLDNCVILYDDKDYILVSFKYYKDVLFTTYHEDIDINDLTYLFINNVENQLRELINYTEYILAPIYFSEDKEELQIVNIGIYILDKFIVNKNMEKYIGEDTRNCFMSVIKYGLEPTCTDIDELKNKRYPELKADIDDILYIKQAGFYFNLLKSLYYTCYKSNNKTYITIPINSNTDVIIDIAEIFEIAYPYWDKWQIIWRSNKYAITNYFNNKKWNSETNLTDNTTKKYRNIVFNQSLMKNNKVINSLKEFNSIQKSERPKTKKTDIDITIEKIGNMNICGKKHSFEKQLQKYSKFSGSKHLHYLQSEKIKEKRITDMLKELGL
jgi:hypothetical protein